LQESSARDQGRLGSDHQQELDRLRAAAAAEQEQVAREHQKEIGRVREEASRERQQLVDEHQQSMDRLQKTSLQEQEQFRHDHKQELDLVHEAAARQHEQLVLEHEKEMARVREASAQEQEQEVANAREAWAKEQELLVKQHQQELDRARKALTQGEEELMQHHQQELARLREASAQELQQLREASAGELQQLTGSHQDEVARLRDATAIEREQLIQDHQQQLAALRDATSREQEQVLLNQQQALAREREASSQEHDRAILELQSELARVRDALGREQEQPLVDHTQELSNLTSKLRDAEEQRERLAAELSYAQDELSREQQLSARALDSARGMDELKAQRQSSEESIQVMRRELERAKDEREKVLLELERTKKQQETGGLGKVVADLRLEVKKAKQAHKDDLARFKGLEPGLKMMEQQKEVHADEVSSMTTQIEKLEAARADLQAEVDNLRLQAGTNRDKLHFLKNLVGRQQDAMATKGLQSPTSQTSPTSTLLRTDSGVYTPLSTPNGRTASRSRMSLGLPSSSDPTLSLAERLTPRGSLIVVSQQGRRASKEAPAETAKDVLVLKIFRKLVLEKFCQLTGEDLNKGLKLDSNPAFINRAELVKVIKRAEGSARTFTMKRAFNKFDPAATGKINGDQFRQALDTHFKIEVDPSTQLWLLILCVIREPSHPLFPWGASKKGGSGVDTPRGSEVLTEGEFTKLLDHPRLIG